MGTIKKWLQSSGMAAVIFMAVIGFVLAMVLSVFFTSGASSPVSEDVEGAYTPGKYTASADGFGGPVEVTVDIGSNGGITDVTIKGDGETPDIGGAAIPVLKQAILEKQSADVDGVSGATFTSDAVKKATAEALAQAGGEEVASGPKAADGNLFIPGTYTETGTGFGGVFGFRSALCSGGRCSRTARSSASLAGVCGGVMAVRYCSAVMVWKKGFLPCSVRAGVWTGARTTPDGAAGCGCFGRTASTLPEVRFRADSAP